MGTCAWGNCGKMKEGREGRGKVATVRARHCDFCRYVFERFIAHGNVDFLVKHIMKL